MGGAIAGLIKPLLDPILDSIGLGALKPIVHAAFDFASGNYLGLIGDLGEMVNSFKGNDMNNVAQQPPIADVFGGNEQGQNVNNGQQAGNAQQNAGGVNGNRPEFLGPPANRMGQLLQMLLKLFGGQGGGQEQGGGIGDIFNALSKLFQLLSQMGQGQDQILQGRQQANATQFA